MRSEKPGLAALGKPTLAEPELVAKVPSTHSAAVGKLEVSLGLTGGGSASLVQPSLMKGGYHSNQMSFLHQDHPFVSLGAIGRVGSLVVSSRVLSRGSALGLLPGD